MNKIPSGQHEVIIAHMGRVVVDVGEWWVNGSSFKYRWVGVYIDRKDTVGFHENITGDIATIRAVPFDHLRDAIDALVFLRGRFRE